MSNSYDWESAYKSGDFKHWEFNHPSPELVTLVAAGLLETRGRVLEVGCREGLDAIFLARGGELALVVGDTPRTTRRPLGLSVADNRLSAKSYVWQWRPVKNVEGQLCHSSRNVIQATRIICVRKWKAEPH